MASMYPSTMSAFPAFRIAPREVHPVEQLRLWKTLLSAELRYGQLSSGAEAETAAPPSGRSADTAPLSSIALDLGPSINRPPKPTTRPDGSWIGMISRSRKRSRSRPPPPPPPRPPRRPPSALRTHKPAATAASMLMSVDVRRCSARPSQASDAKPSMNFSATALVTPRCRRSSPQAVAARVARRLVVRHRRLVRLHQLLLLVGQACRRTAIRACQLRRVLFGAVDAVVFREQGDGLAIAECLLLLHVFQQPATRTASKAIVHALLIVDGHRRVALHAILVKWAMGENPALSLPDDAHARLLHHLGKRGCLSQHARAKGLEASGDGAIGVGRCSRKGSAHISSRRRLSKWALA